MGDVITQKSDATPIPLTLRLFGAFALEVRGQAAPVLSRAARSLIALLALRSQRSIERDFLAASLRPDSDEVAARYNLRRTLTELRAVLGPEAGRLESRGASTLALNLFGGAFCDVLIFDQAVAARTIDAKTEDALLRALELYAERGGTLLEGERGEWILPERASRSEAYLSARARLAQLFTDRGDWHNAVQHLRAILVLDPNRETAVRVLNAMRLTQWAEVMIIAGEKNEAARLIADIETILAHFSLPTVRVLIDKVGLQI